MSIPPVSQSSPGMNSMKPPAEKKDSGPSAALAESSSKKAIPDKSSDSPTVKAPISPVAKKETLPSQPSETPPSGQGVPSRASADMVKSMQGASIIQAPKPEGPVPVSKEQEPKAPSPKMLPDDSVKPGPASPGSGKSPVPMQLIKPMKPTVTMPSLINLAQTEDEKAMVENRKKNLDTFYKSKLERLDIVDQSFVTLDDKSAPPDDRRQAINAIDRSIDRVPDLKKLYQDTYKTKLDPDAATDDTGRKDEFKQFRPVYDENIKNIRNSFEAKRKILAEPGVTLEDPRIQVDRSAPDYRKLVDAYRNSSGFDPNKPASEQVYVPLPPSTNVVTASANTVATYTSDGGGSLVRGANEQLNKMDPTRQSVFEAFARATTQSRPLYIGETPLLSLAPEGKGGVPKEAAVLLATSNENMEAMRDPLTAGVEDYRKRAGATAPSLNSVTFNNEKEFLDAVRKTGDGIKPGESFTVIIGAHGQQEDDPRKPAQMQDLLGGKRSFFYTENKNAAGNAPEDTRLKIYHDNLRSVLFDLEKQGKKANIVFINCYAGGGVAMSVPVLTTDPMPQGNG